MHSFHNDTVFQLLEGGQAATHNGEPFSTADGTGIAKFFLVSGGASTDTETGTATCKIETAEDTAFSSATTLATFTAESADTSGSGATFEDTDIDLQDAEEYVRAVITMANDTSATTTSGANVGVIWNKRNW